MSKLTDAVLRRGKPETRTPFERMRDSFAADKGATLVRSGTEECRGTYDPARGTFAGDHPGGLMDWRKEYRGGFVHVTGKCQDGKKGHDIERFGAIVGGDA